MPVGVELARPLWLLVLVPAALWVVWARLPWQRAARRAGRAALGRERRILALRLVWLLLLSLALAAPSAVWQVERQAIVFVVDASASTHAVRDRAEAWVRQALGELGPADRAAVVAFGEGARIEEALTASPVFTRLGTRPGAHGSDLAAGLSLAGALLPEDYAGRAVLLSDGRPTRGDALAAVRTLRDQGATVDVVALGEAVPADLRLEALEVSEVVYAGERSTLLAHVWSDLALPATLRLYRDGNLITERALALQPGRQTVAVALPPAAVGTARWLVELHSSVPEGDAVPFNNRLSALQRVLGPPAVLLIAQERGAAAPLAAALLAAGAGAADLITPAEAPASLPAWARYDAVFLVDVPAWALPAAAQAGLQQFVHDLGRGLVMTGGPDAFGRGDWADTPVEAALPVHMAVSGRGRMPELALVVVVDKSGSMAEAAGGATRMDLAKDAALSTVELLRPQDQAGVLAFDAVPQWVVRLRPVGDGAGFADAIGSIYAGGGTEIYSALLAAYRSITSAETELRHIILLTDGHSGSGGDYGALTRAMRDEGITLSTVAVGKGSDTVLLTALAQAGRGRYYFTDDAASVPEIFTKETQLASRSVVHDGIFQPLAASAGPLLRGIAATPPLSGYVATTVKDQAETVLLSPQGEPILAAWHYGHGRAVAWTADVAGRWTEAWLGDAAFATLWGNVLAWLLQAGADGNLSVRIETAPDGAARIVAENPTPSTEVRPTTATVIDPDGSAHTVALQPAGPGRYQALWPQTAPGAYLAAVRQQTAAGAVLHSEGGWVVPYSPEYRQMGLDLSYLESLARAGGGRVLQDAAELAAPPRPASARRSLSPLLLVLAALFWPLEIANRRLVLTASERAQRRQRPQRGRGRDAAGPPAPPTAAEATVSHLLRHKRQIQKR